MTKGLLLLLTRWHVTGKENVPAKGPVLIVSNHMSNVDPPLIGVSLGRKTVFMAKEELFRNRFIGAFLRSLGSFPVDRRQFNKASLQEAETVLAQGLTLTMFPEGRRSPDVRLQRGFHGTARIACRGGVPILPVGISGTEQLRRPFWIFRRPRLMVNIGQPFTLPDTGGFPAKEALEQHTETIMRRIAALLPRHYRGQYGENKT